MADLVSRVLINLSSSIRNRYSYWATVPSPPALRGQRCRRDQRRTPGDQFGSDAPAAEIDLSFVGRFWSAIWPPVTALTASGLLNSQFHAEAAEHLHVGIAPVAPCDNGLREIRLRIVLREMTAVWSERDCGPASRARSIIGASQRASARVRIDLGATALAKAQSIGRKVRSSRSARTMLVSRGSDIPGHFTHVSTRNHKDIEDHVDRHISGAIYCSTRVHF